MKKVLFLCTGNSCRSQMAEGWGKYLRSNEYLFLSAGTKKHGMNSIAVKVMKEVGVDISSQESKTLDDVDSTFDYIITVCSDADRNCPIIPNVKTIHFGFDDPPGLTKNLKSESAILVEYRRVRDEIKTMIENLDTILEEK